MPAVEELQRDALQDQQRQQDDQQRPPEQPARQHGAQRALDASHHAPGLST
jgi:hypothetical protein